MKMYELNLILESLHLSQKDSWEQTRMISYIIAQSNSSKTLKLTDVMKFEWDQETEDNDTKITQEDIERIKQKSNEYLKYLNNESNTI
jgi:hypothetical protein